MSYKAYKKGAPIVRARMEELRSLMNILWQQWQELLAWKRAAEEVVAEGVRTAIEKTGEVVQQTAEAVGGEMEIVAQTVDLFREVEGAREKLEETRWHEQEKREAEKAERTKKLEEEEKKSIEQEIAQKQLKEPASTPAKIMRGVQFDIAVKRKIKAESAYDAFKAIAASRHQTIDQLLADAIPYLDENLSDWRSATTDMLINALIKFLRSKGAVSELRDWGLVE